MPRHHHHHHIHRILPVALGAVALLLAVIAVPEPAGAQPVFRIAGADRYETAALISGQFAPTGGPVLVASGENYPDAIAAGWVSGAARWPVLLVRSDSVPAVTRTEIARLGPSDIVVLGGSAAVSDAVVADLGTIGPPVQRVFGADRYGTAAQIVNTILGGAPGPHPLLTVLVASGTDFADAMVAGAVGGAYAGMPLLLVPQSGPLPASVQTTLANLSAQGYLNIVLMASPAEVSIGVEGDLAAAGFAVARVPGANVYQRSVNAWLALPLGAAVDPVITTGENWPDGLAGALFVGQAQAAGITTNPNVMVLTRTDCLPAYVAAALAGSGASRYTILGGPSAVSPAVETPVICP